MNSLRHVTLKQLRSLSAVIRTGSVTAASGEMNVTPPAITAQVKALEDLVQIPLVERIGERFRPTAAGAEIAATLSKMEALLSECGGAISQLKDAGTGRVNFGTVSTAKYFAPHALAAFRRERPNVEIKLMIGNREELIHALKSYDIDLAIMGRPPQTFEVEAQLLGPHPQVFVAAPDHPLAARQRIEPKELVAETFLIRESGSGTRASYEWFMGNELFGTARREIEVSSNETIKQSVMAGFGIALISAHTVASELETGRLKVLAVAGLPIYRDWYVVRRADKRMLPAASALQSFILANAADLLPRVPGLSPPLKDREPG